MKKYLVGGAVRDKLMGRQPKDRDWVIVGANAEDVAKMMSDGFQQVGADFPVFLHPETGEEYALARLERKVGVGYHGFEVTADETVTIEDDLARRDLTINSLALDDNGEVIDPFGGLRDLHNHILRHTTAAFAEDPLRVLRLARFAARFPDWRIANETIELCRALSASGELEHLTTERVWVEMEKGFTEECPRRFMEVLNETGALAGNPILRELFGETLNFQQIQNSKVVACVPKSQRLYVSIGLLARIRSTLPGAPTRAKECHANFSALVSSDCSAVSLMQILKKSRALQEGPQFSDLVMATLTAERAGFKICFSGKQLMTAQHIVDSIRASLFPGVTCKELGQKIEEMRIDNLGMGLGIPTLTSGETQE